MLRGEPIWQTSSTGPMSIPSSSDAVATSARRSPARRRVSTRCRRSFDRLPWCAATDVVAQPLAELMGEPLGEPTGVDEHERGVVLADELGDAVEHVAHLLGGRDRFELALGQLEREVEVALVAGVDDRGERDGRRRAAGRRSRSGAGWPRARCAAGGCSQSASSRSSVSARCAPRLSRATAWISSTMTVSTVRSSSRPFSLVTSR